MALFERLGKETVSVTPGDSSSHRGLGGEMMMHARALDADLGRKVAEAEAPISGVRICASARSINRSAVSLTVLTPLY